MTHAYTGACAGPGASLAAVGALAGDTQQFTDEVPHPFGRAHGHQETRPGERSPSRH